MNNALSLELGAPERLASGNFACENPEPARIVKWITSIHLDIYFGSPAVTLWETKL